MLRFTKTLELVLRKKDSRYSKEFWKGLGLAATFHAALFAIFRIATLPNLDHLHPIVPVQVEIEIETPGNIAVLAGEPLMRSPLDTTALPCIDPLISASFFHINGAPFYMKKGETDLPEIETLEYSPLEHLAAEEP